MPLAYAIEKDGDGNVVIEAKTPKGHSTAKLEARVVIHPDGSSDFSKLDITPLVREPAQQEAPAAGHSTIQTTSGADAASLP